MPTLVWILLAIAALPTVAYLGAQFRLSRRGQQIPKPIDIAYTISGLAIAAAVLIDVLVVEVF